MNKWLLNMDALNLFDLLDILFVGLLIFTGNYLVKKYLIDYFYPSTVKNKKIKNRFPVIETLIWVFFTVYVIYKLVMPFPLVGLFIIVVIVLFSKKQLSSLINGVFIRLKGLIAEGQQITIDGKKGTISEIGSFGIKLENADGSFQLISYNTMQQKEVVLQEIDQHVYSTKFLVTSNKTLSESDVTAFIQKQAFSIEYRLPIIEIEEKDKETHYNLTIFAADRTHLDYLKMDIRHFLK